MRRVRVASGSGFKKESAPGLRAFLKGKSESGDDHIARRDPVAGRRSEGRFLRAKRRRS